MKNRLLIALIAVILAVGATIGGLMAFAVDTTVTLGPGDNQTITCTGPSLTWTQTDATHGVAHCAPNPTTTTQATTTTTRPANGPDLVITALTWSPANPSAGQSVDFTITMKNQGNQTTSGSLGAGLYVDGVGGRWIQVPGTLAPGASVTHDTCTDSCWNSPNWVATNGTHTIRANADDAGNVVESNETNNALTLTLQVGATTTTAPPTTTQPPTTTAPPTTTQPPSNKFTVGSDGLVRDPAGALFKPNGANVGTTCAFDHTGTAIGHSTEAQSAWNWTAIRLNASWDAPGAFCGGTPANMTAAVQAVINEWTPKHIVVVVASHDLTMFNDQAASLNGMSAVAAANKTNPYVWYNCYNEPPYGGANYDVQQKACVDTVRGQGATAPIVMDGQNSANDASWDGVNSPTDGGMAQHCGVLKPYDPQHNIIMSMHNYGGHQTNADLSGWIDAVHGAGCGMVIGEFGYSYVFNGSCGAGDYATNYNAAAANFAVAPGKNVGLIVWHGTMDDSCALRSDGGSYYGTAPLSDLGTKVYAVTH